ncbi:MAG: ATP-binding protein [Candidatus Rokubacteria bacterium]|nr:ATP-binding protein [Candidatus Rokubacteria bacterium]
MGETRVDLLHLLEDLRDAYPGATEETILTEIVANSLDSGATTITIATDPAAPALTIVDDGLGMRRRELARYHDIAASTKVKGERIGFAGVGIKIGLLVSREVLTETRLGKHHVATSWGLASRHRAPWRWVAPPGLVAGRGTAVRLALTNALSPLLDPGFIEGVVRRQFQPLLDPALGEILAGRYPRGVRVVLNGVRLEKQGWNAPEVVPIAVRLARKRKPAAAGYMVRDHLPLPEERRGIAVSTFGKVIKRGWDWLGVTPAAAEHVGGLIEVPGLAECLTLNKADFIRAGARGATYLAYRKAIQEAVSRQLALWGDARDAGEPARRRAARPVERDLETVLMDLAEEFPLLATLVEQRAGGQRRLPGTQSGPGPWGGPETPILVATSQPEPAERGEREPAPPAPAGGEPGEPAAAPHGEEPVEPRPAEAHPPAPRGPRRPARYGLSIRFEARPGDPELGRLVESTVWVNEAHPAYRRAVASRSEGYHVALATAMALAPLAVEPAKEHAFVTAFLASWGAALDRRKGPRRR